MWIKYKHKWAHGFGPEAYIEIPDDVKSPTQYLRELGFERENEWSDKYRGFTCSKVKHPPLIVLERELRYTKEKYTSAKNQMVLLKKQIAEHPESSK